jgi:hypothetical protein
VERAISHEQSLDRPGATSWPPKPKLPPRPS